MKTTNESSRLRAFRFWRIAPVGLAGCILLPLSDTHLPTGKTAGVPQASASTEGLQLYYVDDSGRIRVGKGSSPEQQANILRVSPPSAERLRVNQLTVVPELSSDPGTGGTVKRVVPTAVAEVANHAVAPGQNGWTIAQQRKVKPTELARLNPGVDFRRLQIGQTLSVTNPRSVSEALVVAEPVVSNSVVAVNAEPLELGRREQVRLAATQQAGAQVSEPVPTESITVLPGQSRVMEFRGIKRAVVGNPAVADVVPVSATELILNTKTAGETTLFVWDDRGRHSYRVIVGTPAADLGAVARQLQEAIADPAIRVRSLGSAIFLEGTVTDPAAAQRAELMAKALAPNVTNLIRVNQPPAPVAPTPAPPPPAGPVIARTLSEALGSSGITARAVNDRTVLVEGAVNPAVAERARRVIGAIDDRSVTIVDNLAVAAPLPAQVLIRARVVDINRAKVKDLGLDWGRVTGGSQVGGTGRRRQGAISAQPFLFGIFGNLFQGDIDVQNLDPFGARLNALIQENAARILSEPNILVLEGAKGNILVGGEFPVPVVQNAVGGLGSVSVEFKEFGVRLGVEPVTVAGTDITLRVAPEVSLLDFANGVQVSGFNLPALRTRREESMVRITSGQTLAIGGLLENNYQQTVRRIPLLSKIPILGELFKSRNWQRNETELVILITPEVVPAGASPTPTPLAGEAARIPLRSPIVPEPDRDRDDRDE